VAPLLGEPEQTSKGRELPVERGRRDLAAEARDLRRALAIILGDPVRGDLGDQQLIAEGTAELPQVELVTGDRALPLPALELEVLRGDLVEGLWRHDGRRRRSGELEAPRVERRLRVLTAPLGRILPLLFPADRN